MEYNPSGSSVHEIFQARVLERLLFPSPSDPGIEPMSPVSPALQEDSLPAEPLGKQAPLAYLFSTYKLNLFTLDFVGFVEIIF